MNELKNNNINMNYIQEIFVSGIQREWVASYRTILYLIVFKFSEHKHIMKSIYFSL